MRQRSEHMQALKKLTEELPPLFGDITQKRVSGAVDVDMDKGDGFGLNLLHQPEIAVSRWYSPKGSLFPRHQHSEREWIIVYRGELTLHVECGDKVLGAGDSFVVPPHVPHSASFRQDCWYIAITIPASKDFPHG